MTLQPSYSCSFISPENRRAPLSVTSNPAFTRSPSPPVPDHSQSNNNNNTTNNTNNNNDFATHNNNNSNNNNNNHDEARPHSPPPSLGTPSNRGENLPNGRLGTDQSRLCSPQYGYRKPTHFLFPPYQVSLPSHSGYPGHTHTSLPSAMVSSSVGEHEYSKIGRTFLS
uniref:GATA zinc finger domain-containing protein 14-like n=1 Tax=Steinernema glaseri TaxID=37863 RepID=A0A1I7YVG6_9BILA